MAAWSNRLAYGGCLHALLATLWLDQLSYARHARLGSQLSLMAPVAACLALARFAIYRLRTRYSLPASANAGGHNGHQHSTHVQPDYAGTKVRSKWQLRSSVGA